MIENIEITKREVIVSIAITAIMITIGLFIGRNIDQANLESAKNYDTAIKIDNNTDLFRHCMNTNTGKAFVYGDLIAIDTVTFPEIGGMYMSARKIKEEYTKHYRIVYEYDDEGNISGSHEEEYWTWDEICRESIHCEKVNFCGVDFDYEQIDTPGMSYITTEYEKWDNDIRYIYYGEETSHIGTLYTQLENGTISQSNRFYNNTDITHTIESLKNANEWSKTLFWLFWVILTTVVIIGFCALENKYLEDF